MLILESVLIENDTKENILKGLKKIAECDGDFIGYNGTDYLYPQAKEKGYKSNLDFVIDEVKDIKDHAEMIIKFLEKWLEADDYYREYQYNILRDWCDNIKSISVSMWIDD